MVNTPEMIKEMCKLILSYEVKPEVEIFDSENLWFAKELVEQNILPKPVLAQLCMGIPWGAPDDLNTFHSRVNNLPPS